MKNGIPGNASVQSVERALSILEAVLAEPEGVSLAGLSATLGLKKPTLFALAGTLVSRGYLRKSDSPARYHRGPFCRNLGGAAPAESKGSHDAVVVRTLRALARELRRGILIYAELRDHESRTEFRLEAGSAKPLESRVGRRQAPYSTASNLCLLAFSPAELREAYLQLHPVDEFGAGLWRSESVFRRKLRAVARAGYAELDQPSGWRLAVPCWAANGELLGALGVAEEVGAPFENRGRVCALLIQQAQSFHS
ncbi:MAG: helix-turn-helix domain-containing protein [Blastochloris sp.]|nr:helix-turn-helix domain-containing protein [Blastochloris sp.]